MVLDDKSFQNCFLTASKDRPSVKNIVGRFNLSMRKGSSIFSKFKLCLKSYHTAFDTLGKSM